MSISTIWLHTKDAAGNFCTVLIFKNLKLKDGQYFNYFRFKCDISRHVETINYLCNLPKTPRIQRIHL